MTTPDGTPTATEFIPVDEAPDGHEDDYPMVRILQATGDDGMEVVAHEPYDDVVENHAWICDQCGYSAFDEMDMAHHLEHQHVVGDDETEGGQ